MSAMFVLVVRPSLNVQGSNVMLEHIGSVLFSKNRALLSDSDGMYEDGE